MSINKYSTIVEWSEGDECFIARVPEFPTLSAFGDTREEAISEAAAALQLFLETYAADRIELPEPRTVSEHSGKLQLRLPKSLHRQLSEGAEVDRVSLNTYIVKMLSERHSSARIAADVRSAIRDAVDGVHKTWLDIHFRETPQSESYFDDMNTYQVIPKQNLKLWADPCRLSL
ncbi:MAG: toxin-antitoxin system HicB family antitoxin [Proteobacteria bacterium]|nr:toxin-antitoxin system HicB family antitoxin [Pseudomonadota bacterium]